MFFFFFFFWLGVSMFGLMLLWVYWSDSVGLSTFRETMSTFECGFDSKKKARLPFSLRFFLILMFFLLLDMEVCLLLQLPYEVKNHLYGKRLWFFIFFFMLLSGVVEEYRRGFLFWKK